MNDNGHRLTTKVALDILGDIETSLPSYMKNPIILQMITSSSSRYGMKGDIPFLFLTGTDYLEDVKFVDVEFSILKDNIHSGEEGWNFSAFNHFIDIKKGEGQFDDYDGYSYKKGSISWKDSEYQDADDALASAEKWQKIVADLSGNKVDEGIALWLNDEYVYAPGQDDYKIGSSQAIERYSFPEDKGIYKNVQEECKARFPLADSIGVFGIGNGKGVPWSVFMPIDNLARYWYQEFMSSDSPIALGHVMHAIQDASIPHHAAACNGNWHGRYEDDFADYIRNWYGDSHLLEEVKELVIQWSEIDCDLPKRLEITDWRKIPAQNWRIDQLVTWVALNAFKEYEQTYHSFRNGYKFNTDSAKHLAKLAVAMSTFVLRNAIRFNQSKHPAKPSDAKWEQTSYFHSNAPPVLQDRSNFTAWRYDTVTLENGYLQHYWFSYKQGQWFKGRKFGTSVNSEPIVFQSNADIARAT